MRLCVRVRACARACRGGPPSRVVMAVMVACVWWWWRGLSPVRCGCEAFYDPGVAANDTLLAAVLPYVCAGVVAFKQGPWEPLNARCPPPPP